MEGQTDKMDVDHSQQEDGEGNEEEREQRGRRNQRGWGDNGGLVVEDAPQTTLSISLSLKQKLSVFLFASLSLSLSAFINTLPLTYFLLFCLFDCISALSLSCSGCTNRGCFTVSVRLLVESVLTRSLQPADGALVPSCCTPTFLPLCVCVSGSSFPHHSCSHPWRHWPPNKIQGHRAKYQAFVQCALMYSAFYIWQDKLAISGYCQNKLADTWNPLVSGRSVVC